MPTESEIRDHLAADLSILGQGELTLIKTEYHLPNPNGADGFIDILANDEEGNLVVIELKKSNSVARQALHELVKYTSLLRLNYGGDEISVRCILVSTEWHELIAPFSAFVLVFEYDVTGVSLVVNDSGVPVSASPVELIEAPPAIDPCPHHFAFGYEENSTRDASISEIKNALTERGVENFFVLVEDYCGSAQTPFRHRAYVVVARLPISVALSLIEGPEEAEILEEDEWCVERKLFGLISLDVTHDTVENSGPDKYGSDSDDWETVSAVRGGVFIDERIWPIRRLISTCEGSATKYTIRFSDRATPRRPKRWNSVLANAHQVLLGAQQWAEDLDTIVSLLEAEKPQEATEIAIYNPADIIWTLFALANASPSWVPTFRVGPPNLADSHPTYMGQLAWDGVTFPSDPETLLSAVYSGGSSEYMVARHFNEHWTVDEELCGLHGLTYEAYRVLGPGELARLNAKASDEAGRRLSIFEFAASNPNYMNSVHAFYSERTIGPGMFTF